MHYISDHDKQAANGCFWTAELHVIQSVRTSIMKEKKMGKNVDCMYKHIALLVNL